jgi:hypothetical protein
LSSAASEVHRLIERAKEMAEGVGKCHDPQGIAAKVGKRDKALGAVMAHCFVG